jgi:acyl-CoA synthetase (NDP forming)
VKAVIVVTAGFGELGEEGARLEAEMARVARESEMLLVGPNCMGVVSPAPRSLYCEMPAVKPKPGAIAMASQSGNVGASLMLLAAEYHVGISRCVSSGNEASLHIEDYIEYFGEDPRTNVIAVYIEGVDDGRRFFDVARDVSRTKPIVVLKVGTTDAGRRAAKSHTGALAGSREIFHGACRQAGLTEVVDLEEMIEIIAAFGRQPLPRGRRVGIVTIGGGWGVLASDACAEFGLDVVALPDKVCEELDKFLPPWWNRSNPVDLVGGFVERGLVRSVEALIRCDEIDGVIALGVGLISRRVAQFRNSDRFNDDPLYEQMAGAAVRHDLDEVNTLVRLMDEHQKPVIIASHTVWTGHRDGNEAVMALFDQGVTAYATPRRAARAFAHLAERYEYLASVGAEE